MTPVLRPLAAADLDRVLAIARLSSEAPQWDRGHYDQILLKRPESLLERYALVALNGCEVSGFMVAGILPGEKFSELETIAVHPDLRRRGFGAALLMAAMAYAAGAGATRMELELRESNQAAADFYQQHGFHLSGRRASYYRDPQEDALLLEAPLASSGA